MWNNLLLIALTVAVAVSVYLPTEKAVVTVAIALLITAVLKLRKVV